MTKKTSIVVLASCVLLAGCSPDHSSDTRQVNTPNPPVTMPGAPASPITDNPKIPEATKKMMSHVAPGLNPGK